MTACTDDERRRVAERLRRLNAPSLIAMMSILDVGGRDMCARLADLIDPDCEEGRYSVARTVRPVDREALLALASTCDSMGDMCAEAHLETANDELNGLLRKIAEFEWKTARIIRKAIGVDDAD